MIYHTDDTTKARIFADERQLLWQTLKSSAPESNEYRNTCNALLAPIIYDLKKNSYAKDINRTVLLQILSHYDEYGEAQEFILSRLWQALPNSLSDSGLKPLIATELNQLLYINNQLIFGQYNLR